MNCRARFTTTLLLTAALASFQTQAAPSPERQKELTRFVRQECGFCHGLRLTGGLGSPLTFEAMQVKPQEVLTAAILHGMPGTAMPGWAPFLSEAEAEWIAEALRKGFPE